MRRLSPGRLRPRLPSIGHGAPASPWAHHVCCSLARTSGATINKCTGRGPAPAREQMPQRPLRGLPRCHVLIARKGRRYFLYFRASGLPGHNTSVEQRCSWPPQAPQKDVGDKQFQIMTIGRRIWGGDREKTLQTVKAMRPPRGCGSRTNTN